LSQDGTLECSEKGTLHFTFAFEKDENLRFSKISGANWGGEVDGRK
jgi:hypothetical protein